MTASWHFYAVRAANSFGFAWQWQKQDSKAALTSIPFDFYFDCISDARAHGYAGGLPPARKVPLEHLPAVSHGMKVIAARAPPVKPAKGVMSVTSVSPAAARKRHFAVS